jgi:hypothetical protein
MATSEPAKLATETAADAESPTSRLNEMASIAPSAAPADTPSVKGVASGLRSSACSTTPAAASRRRPARRPARAAAAPRRRSARPRCRPTASRVEDARQADRRCCRASARRSSTASVKRPNAGRRPRAAGAGSDRHGIRPPPGGTTVRWPVALVTCTSASRRTASRTCPASAPRRWARAMTRPRVQHHQLAAERGGKVQIVRGHGNRDAAVPFSRRSSDATSSW